MRLLITGNNDGPLRLLRSLRAAEAPLPLAIALQKPPSEVLAETYRQIGADVSVERCPDEASTLALCDRLAPTHILNCFANYKFRGLLTRAACVNVHLAPLPHYRGRHPLQWALINGERRFGATVHEMNERWDDGAILHQVHVDVPPLSSALELRELLMRALEREFGAFWSAYAKTGGNPQPNPAEAGSYLPRRTPADSALVEWDDLDRVVRKVHALRDDPHPAFLTIGTERFAVVGAHLADGSTAGAHPSGLEVAWVSGRELGIAVAPQQIVVLRGSGEADPSWTGRRVAVDET